LHDNPGANKDQSAEDRFDSPSRNAAALAFEILDTVRKLLLDCGCSSFDQWSVLE